MSVCFKGASQEDIYCSRFAYCIECTEYILPHCVSESEKQGLRPFQGYITLILFRSLAILIALQYILVKFKIIYCRAVLRYANRSESVQSHPNVTFSLPSAFIPEIRVSLQLQQSGRACNSVC